MAKIDVVADSGFLELRLEAKRLRARSAVVVAAARRLAAGGKPPEDAQTRVYQEARYVRHARGLGFGGEELSQTVCE